MSLRPPAGPCVFAFVAALLLPLYDPCDAQAQAQTLAPEPKSNAEAEPAAVPPATQTLDLTRLLTDRLVEDANLGDAVWQLDEVEGRSPMLIPIRLTPGQIATEFDDPAVSLDGARFVGWWVPEPTNDPNANPGSRSTRVRAATPRNPDNFAQQPRFVAGDSRFARLLGDPNTDPTRGALNEPTLEPLPKPAAPGPRLARSITVQPDGRVTWELDRTFQGASLNTGDNLYILKLDPLRLREKQPEPAARPSRNNGETTAAYNLRRREAQNAFRAEQQTFRDLRASVQNLPETFDVSLDQLPGQVAWAVYLKQDRRPTLTFDGDETQTELPWSVELETFAALRGNSGSRGAGTADVDPLTAMTALASEDNALSMRAAAIALTAGTSNGFREMTIGDPTAALAQKLVLSTDALAARTVIEALADVDPPTDATRRLLDIAARTDDPLAKLAALRASLRSSADNPAAVARILQQAVAVLTDPAGPPPEEVLAALAGTNATNQRGGAPESAVPALTLGVPFESISDAQRAGAVRWVLQHADDPQSLPAAWLDVRLLGGDHEPLLRETLDQLTAAEVLYPQDAVAPVIETPTASPTRAFREFVFGANNDTPTESAETATPAAPPLQIAPLPLTSPQHGLIAALAHPDAALQAQAWRVLPKFTINAPNARTDAGPILNAIVAAAPTPTPGSLVPFLQNALRDSATSPPATASLMQLAATGDPSASSQAIDALLTPTVDARGQTRRLSLNQAWQNLESDTRVAFTAAFYLTQLGSDTPVAALAAHDRAGSWFIRQFDQGEVPAPGDWLEPLGGETQAIDVAASPDDALAHGALAALAAAVGADADAQRDVIERLGTAPRVADELQVAWPGMQRELIVGQLQDAAGEYRLTLLVTEATPDGQPTDPAMAAGRDTDADPLSQANNPDVESSNDADDTPADIVPITLVLGLVELTVNDTRVALVGDPVTLDVPETFAALRITDPMQLRNFPTPGLADLPLQQAAAPIDLRRDADGTRVWSGQTAFGDAHTLEVRLEPGR
ncbi:MAG: hypothetical protein AAF328_02725 [Planctomycetota bacterium]